MLVGIIFIISCIVQCVKQVLVRREHTSVCISEKVNQCTGVPSSDFYVYTWK